MIDIKTNFAKNDQELGFCRFLFSGVSLTPRFVGVPHTKGHKYGGRKISETSAIELCYWKEKSFL